MSKDEGERRKKDGMGRAEDHANEHWKWCMQLSVKAVARGKWLFDAEDVTRYCLKNHPNARTHEQRAMGPVMRRGAKAGYCKATGEWNKSTLPQNHRRPQMAWESLIYEGPPPPTKRRPRRPKALDPRQFDLFDIRIPDNDDEEEPSDE